MKYFMVIMMLSSSLVCMEGDAPSPKKPKKTRCGEKEKYNTRNSIDRLQHAIKKKDTSGCCYISVEEISSLQQQVIRDVCKDTSYEPTDDDLIEMGNTFMEHSDIADAHRELIIKARTKRAVSFAQNILYRAHFKEQTHKNLCFDLYNHLKVLYPNATENFIEKSFYLRAKSNAFSYWLSREHKDYQTFVRDMLHDEKKTYLDIQAVLYTSISATVSRQCGYEEHTS